MRPSRRLERIPPYLFAELERKIAAKRAAGIDVISLGIGDPDTPTYPPSRRRPPSAAVADPSTHTYPSNRGRAEFREAVAAFYARRFGVTLDPETEVMPAIGAKECIFNLNLAFLDPGDVALAADPGYPVYTGGPLLAGGEAVLMPLRPEPRVWPRSRGDPDPATSSAPGCCSSTTRTTRPARSSPTGCSRTSSSSPAAPGCSPSTTTPTARRPTTATWRRRSWPRPGPRRSASRCSRSPRATT